MYKYKFLFKRGVFYIIIELFHLSLHKIKYMNNQNYSLY